MSSSLLSISEDESDIECLKQKYQDDINNDESS
jgi:hypothetical protein